MAGNLTAQDKADRSRQRMIEHARQFQIGTYTRKVARDFQRMIRAEYGAQPSGLTVTIVNGELSQSLREVGFCACVTCGRVSPWTGNKGFHCGHFLASRRNSILFEEDNVAPQCAECNQHRNGEQQLFRKWMLAVRGIEVVERLERLKNEVVSFTREQLVDMRIGYAARLKAAEARMK